MQPIFGSIIHSISGSMFLKNLDQSCARQSRGSLVLLSLAILVVIPRRIFLHYFSLSRNFRYLQLSNTFWLELLLNKKGYFCCYSTQASCLQAITLNNNGSNQKCKIICWQKLAAARNVTLLCPILGLSVCWL